MTNDKRAVGAVKTVRGVLSLTALTALAALTASPLLAQDHIGLPLGTIPPVVQIQDTSGAAVDLSRHVGKRPVVFEFYATWCEVCQALLPRLEAAQRQYGRQVDFVVIGVGVNETLNSMKRHIQQHPEPFTYYFDGAGAAVRAFDVPSTGTIIALDAHGRVVYGGGGTDQDLVAVARTAASAR